VIRDEEQEERGDESRQWGRMYEWLYVPYGGGGGGGGGVLECWSVGRAKQEKSTRAEKGR
jgi:hypothetical protein